MNIRARAAGFTLVELLVAMAIFALIGVMAYGGLNNVVAQRQQNDQVMQRLRQVQQAFTIMSRDFEQLAPRPIRDELGSVRPPLQAGPLNVPPIEFTHGGWPNPLGILRSTQQRVAYALEDGQLMRYSWLELDRAPQSEAQKQLLLPDVMGMDVEFMNPSDGSYANQWPSLNTNPPPPLPNAVSIKLTLKDWGEVTRIVEVAHPPMISYTHRHTLTKQRGVALLTVLVILAIATVMSAAMIWDRGLDQQRTATLVQGDQALEYALGAEAWAEQILRRDQQQHPGTVSLSEDWATQLPPLPVEGGQVSGRLEDMQGRFNLNTLAGGNNNNKLQFERLLAALNIDLNTVDVDAIIDWVTAGNLATPPDGAKDDFYSRLQPPYRTADQPITSSSELELVKGMTPQLYARLSPYVCALPVSAASVNINTAPVPVLQSLADGITAAIAAAAAEKRLTTSFTNTADAFPGVDLGKMAPAVGFASKYFLLTTTVEIGSTHLTMYSLLSSNGKTFTAVQRTFGTY